MTGFCESNCESGIPIESQELFKNKALLVHKHGNPDQPNDVNEGVEQLETLHIYEILPEIIEMWKAENKQMSVSKKKRGK